MRPYCGFFPLTSLRESMWMRWYRHWISRLGNQERNHKLRRTQRYTKGNASSSKGATSEQPDTCSAHSAATGYYQNSRERPGLDPRSVTYRGGITISFGSADESAPPGFPKRSRGKAHCDVFRKAVAAYASDFRGGHLRLGRIGFLLRS